MSKKPEKLKVGDYVRILDTEHLRGEWNITRDDAIGKLCVITEQEVYVQNQNNRTLSYLLENNKYRINFKRSDFEIISLLPETVEKQIEELEKLCIR